MGAATPKNMLAVMPKLTEREKIVLSTVYWALDCDEFSINFFDREVVVKTLSRMKGIVEYDECRLELAKKIRRI